MLVGKLAMFVSRSRVFLCLFVFAELVVMGRLKVMMRGGMVVSGGIEVMLTPWMFWCLCHLQCSSICNSQLAGSDYRPGRACRAPTGARSKICRWQPRCPPQCHNSGVTACRGPASTISRKLGFPIHISVITVIEQRLRHLDESQRSISSGKFAALSLRTPCARFAIRAATKINSFGSRPAQEALY
jgi:hypothetical protein